MSSHDTRARDAIMTKLRSATADRLSLFRDEDVDGLAAAVPSAVTSAAGNAMALARAFGQKLEQVLGSYQIVENADDVPGRIAAKIDSWLAASNGTAPSDKEILSWAPTELPTPNLSERLDQHGLSLFVPSDLHDKVERAHASTLSVGLTGVDAAFAGTGSMALIHGPGKSRAASLLPLHHIALVPFSKLHETFESWLATLRSAGTLDEVLRAHSQLAFVTGPSKSADIELNLTLGVHGPRDVHAIVFDDGA